MQEKPAKRLDSKARAQAKQASRDADARSLRSERVAGEQLAEDNAAFGWAARSARIKQPRRSAR